MKDDIVEVINYKGYRIEIVPMGCPDNPRDWDNLCKIVGYHPRYHIGDEDLKMSLEDMLTEIMKREDLLMVKPLYMYEHSGVAFSINSFGDHWDSGQVGYIYVTYPQAMQFFGMTREELDNHYSNVSVDIGRNMKRELELYEQYCNGDVYAYVVSKNGRMVDSCAGYFGTAWTENGLWEQATSAIEEDIIDAEKNRITREELICYARLHCDECSCDDCTDYEGNETIGPCRCCPKECIVIHQMLGDYHE